MMYKPKPPLELMWGRWRILWWREISFGLLPRIGYGPAGAPHRIFTWWRLWID